MARKSGGGGGGGDSGNTGLVVSLVIASLLVIGLGVTTYLGYSGQADLRSAEASAKADKAKVQTALDETKTVLAALRLAVGVSGAEDQTSFTGNKSRFQGPIQSQLAALSAKVPEVKWDITAPGAPETPSKTCIGRIADLTTQVSSEKNKGDGKAADLEGKMKTLAEELSDTQNKLKVASDNNKKMQAEIEMVRKQRAEAAEATSTKLTQVSSEKQKLDLEKQELDVKKSAEVKKANDLAESKEKKLAELRDRMGPLLERIDAVRRARPEVHELSELYDLITRNLAPFSSVANDTPKGQIVRIDRASNVVYLNLGSADYLKPGVTFSVLPTGTTGKTAAGRDRKGAIEVVSVLEPHLSTAKVIDAPNALRDPLLPGDLLFNPAWSPSNRQHVALAGIFDLNGDGVDDIEDLKRTLEKAGVTVDAWLDIKDRTIKGPGLTERTTYLIQGVTPKPSQAQGLDNNSPVQSALLDLLGKQTQFEAQALSLGVEKVPYLKFLAMIGYKLPKGGPSVDASASSYLRDAKGQIKPSEKVQEK